MESQTGISILNLMEGLGYCLAVFFLGIYLYKRFVLRQSGPIKRHMQIVERLQLTTKSSLVLVEIEGRKVVLSVGSERTSFLPDALIEGDALIHSQEEASLSNQSYESYEISNKVDLCQAAN